jgi:hypothetical protein
VLLSVEGFLPEAAFGRGFVPEKPWRQRKPQVEIRAPVDVLEAPGGAKLASLLMDLDGIRLGAAKDGHVLVRLDVAMELVVIGWVKRDAIRPLMKRLAGVIGGVTGPGVRAQKLYQGPSHAPELKRGEILYDAPDGQPVAVVLVTATHEPTGKAPAGWTQFTLPGPWGEAVLYRRQR